MTDPNIYIFGGGTISHVRPHLALSAPAYGGTAQKIAALIQRLRRVPDPTFTRGNVHLLLTKMADPASSMTTNADVSAAVDTVLADPQARLVFMSAALCDFDGHILNGTDVTDSGKQEPRLQSSSTHTMRLVPADKVIRKIRKVRKDIFLVGFKTTAGATVESQFAAGLALLKTNSCNLVFANDVHTRVNMVITPEEVPYSITTDRDAALHTLVNMALLRTDLTFTRSVVMEAPLVPWASDTVPASLRAVVNHCITKGAYKPFMGKTVGHFAFKPEGADIITSIRKSNFNDLDKTGMVRIHAVGDDSVIAYGAKPSVGGQSQRIIFQEHEGLDSIVHFHCPVKPRKYVPSVSQFAYECGSHECGQNTSDGLQWVEYGGAKFKAVYLDGHGPNIVFHHDTPGAAITDYIDEHFDLSVSTGEARLRAYASAEA